jgi:hypothetical protein
MDRVILIVTTGGISLQQVSELSARGFGDMVKAVVDVRLQVMALGGELHADEEQVLLDRGSAQEDLWGINIYPELAPDERVEFDALINIRPSQGNRSRGVEDGSVRSRILDIVARMIRD